MTTKTKNTERRLLANVKLTMSVLCLTLVFASGTYAATYYINYEAANDASAGTSKATAWKRHPYMRGWSGHYLHSAGDRFIFKGGITWDHTCFPMTIEAGGAAGNYDYYGTDETWYAGSAWTRPCFDGEYLAEELINIVHQSYVQIDNLELKSITCTYNFGPGLIDGGGTLRDLLISNCYLHGWRVTTAKDDAHGGIIMNFWSAMTNIVVDHCEIENSENNNRPNGVCIRQVVTVKFSKLHDAPTAILFAGDIHDNEIYNIDWPYQDFDNGEKPYHTNMIYIDSWNGNQPITSPGYCYNNYCHDWGNGAAPVYPNPHDGKTIYVFNNVLYGHMSAQLPIEIDPFNYYAGGSDGIVYCFNNTIINYGDGWSGIHVCDRSKDVPPVKLNTLVVVNNHIIGNNANITDANPATCTNITVNNNLVQSITEATAQGYLASNLWQPTSSSGFTVDQGASAPAPIINQDILGRSRPIGTAWDIGAYEYASGPLGSPSATRTTTSTGTITPTNSITRTRTQTPVVTATPTSTMTSLVSPPPSRTITSTRTASSTRTLTRTLTPTRTRTPIRSVVPTSTRTPLLSDTPIQTPTATPRILEWSGKAIIIFPNPAAGLSVSIQFQAENAGPAEVVVHNVAGRLVSRRDISIASPGRQTVQYAVDKLVNGVYVVTIRQAGKSLGIKRLVVKR